MITRQAALRTMQEVHHDGERKIFSIAWLTANREQYRKKQNLKAMQNKHAADTAEYKSLQAQIDVIHTGGRLIEHDRCVLSGNRGLHAVREKAIKQDVLLRRINHGKLRTRNIILLPGKNTRTIHNSLVMKLNNEEVMY